MPKRRHYASINVTGENYDDRQAIGSLLQNPVVTGYQVRGYLPESLSQDMFIGLVCEILPHAPILIDGVEAN